jgi:hypothetical protein
MEALKNVEGQRDEALAKLADAEQEIEDLGVKLSDAEGHAPDGVTVESLMEKLAARPEPVVIDEALATQVAEELWGSQAHFGTRVPKLLETLRHVLGDHASVAVPQDGPRFQVTFDEWAASGAAVTHLRNALNDVLAKRQPTTEVERQNDHEALAKLAARPEPVVITPQFANRLSHRVSEIAKVGVSGESLLAALRAELGVHVSVSVPQGESARRARAQYEELRQGWQKTTTERDQLRVELEKARASLHGIAGELDLVEYADGTNGYRQASDERIVAEVREFVTAHKGTVDMSCQQRQQLDSVADVLGLDCEPSEVGVAAIEAVGALRAELEKTRAELKSCEDDIIRGGAQRLRILMDAADARKQHEAFHAALDEHILEMEDEGSPSDCLLVYDRGYAAACRLWAVRLRTLLKPAAADSYKNRDSITEPQTQWLHTSSDGDAHTFQHSETGEERTVEGMGLAEAAWAVGEPVPVEAPVRCDYGDECSGHASPADRPCGYEEPQAPAVPEGWTYASEADALRPNDRHALKPATRQEQALDKLRNLAKACGPLPCSMLAVGTPPPQVTQAAVVARVWKELDGLWQVLATVAGEASPAARMVVLSSCRKALAARKETGK